MSSMAVDSVPIQRVQHGNVEIAYWVHGLETGVPLVLITGLATPASSWGPLPAVLSSSGYRVIVIDNRDAGESSRCPGTEYTAADMASDVISVLDDVGIEKSNVLGISLGGMIAQEVALNYPDRVEKLVLVATDPGIPERVIDRDFWNEFQSLAALPVTERMKELVKLMTGPGFSERNPSLAEQMVATRSSKFEPDAFFRQFNASTSFGASDRLPKLKLPVMVIHGKLDRMIPFPNGMRIAELIPGCELVEIETSGHLVPAEAPKEFLEALSRFLPV